MVVFDLVIARILFDPKKSGIWFKLAIADPIKLFFFANKDFFPFFAAKLGHFIINYFFLYVTNTQTKQQKSENEEKKFDRIGYQVEFIMRIQIRRNSSWLKCHELSWNPICSFLLWQRSVSVHKFDSRAALPAAVDWRNTPGVVTPVKSQASTNPSLHSLVDFTNIIWAAFTRADLKSTKRNWRLNCLFELLGSAS